MSDWMRDNVRIQIMVSGGPQPPAEVRWHIDRPQALQLHIGRGPSLGGSPAEMTDYAMRCRRAETLANHIASTLAHEIMKAFNPGFGR